MCLHGTEALRTTQESTVRSLCSLRNVGSQLEPWNLSLVPSAHEPYVRTHTFQNMTFRIIDGRLHVRTTSSMLLCESKTVTVWCPHVCQWLEHLGTALTGSKPDLCIIECLDTFCYIFQVYDCRHAFQIFLPYVFSYYLMQCILFLSCFLSSSAIPSLPPSAMQSLKNHLRPCIPFLLPSAMHFLFCRVLPCNCRQYVLLSFPFLLGPAM